MEQNKRLYEVEIDGRIMMMNQELLDIFLSNTKNSFTDVKSMTATKLMTPKEIYKEYGILWNNGK